MSSANKTLDPKENVRLGAIGPKLVKLGAIVGVVGLGATAAIGAAIGDDMRRFFFAYLLALTFFISISSGALFFVAIHHLVRAKWSVAVRRIAELLGQGFPLLGVLLLGIAIPTLLGYQGLYEWTDPHVAHHDHLIHGKTGWLNPTFFAIRLVIYAAIWIGLSRYFFKKSVAQDAGGKEELSESMRIASAPALLGYAIVTAFSSFDLLMSLEPRWFSTMFPVYFFAGCAVSIYAVLALVPMWLQKRGILASSITTEHYHDVGKLLFAFIFFWGYIAFSQFMLIWYANIPEETFWFKYRMFGSWQGVTIALLFVHFVIPFPLLMSRHTKRRRASLALFAIWALVAHWLDLFWLVMPEYSDASVSFHIIDLVALIGVGGLFLAAVARAARPVSLIPVNDPRLGESLAFENV